MTLSTWILLVLVVSAPSPNKRDVYFTAIKQYRAKQYTQSAKSFKLLLSLLNKEQAQKSANSDAWHFFTFGQCDASYYLADIAWKQQKQRLSCRYHKDIQNRLKTLPPQSKNWTVNVGVKQRLKKSQAHLTGQCTRVPSLLKVTTTPSNAEVSYQHKGKWVVAKNQTISSTQTKVMVRVRAKNFQAKAPHTVTVPRWQTKTITIKLEPVKTVLVNPTPPPQRPILIQNIPPSSPPIYKTWWFWTITGVVVAGATTATVLGVYLNSPIVHEFGDKANNKPYKLWE